MTRRIIFTAIVLAAALFGAAASDSYAAPAEYVPFVTDFPQPSEPYVPFVSDFPKPAASPAPAAEPDASWVDWSGGIGFESGVATVFAALLAAAGLVLVRRRQARPPLSAC